MKFLKIFTLLTVVMVIMSPVTSAHSGRTDSSGGHNCSAKSQSKGLCTGYHYHNSGSKSSSTSSSSKSSSSSTKKSTKSTTSSSVKKEEYVKSNVKLYVNDELILLENSPLVKNDTNYYPVREVAKAIEATVSVDTNKSEINITKDKKTNILDTNSKTVITKNYVTYAPIRDIVSNLGVQFTYDSKKNEIRMTYKKV